MLAGGRAGIAYIYLQKDSGVKFLGKISLVQ